MRPKEEIGRTARVPEDGVYTIAHLRNALERDEWDMPQYSPDDVRTAVTRRDDYQSMDGNNFAVCQLVDVGEWRDLPVVGRSRAECL